ncbi:hypothetical protein LWI29_016158 [Acer saccharum]|uniref:AAA+ ATPase domain-containing protein n=1 Tax=Acer saccharum TaxID=4024 RepID=A0AA39T034_ACESA|nr:hypothetical protein LWI29_016158 [Acer saccharum]
MEVVAAILGSAVTETCRSLCGYYPSIKNFISFQSNLSALEKEKKSLVDLKNKVIEDVDYSSDAQMTQWLQEVEQILLEVNSVPTGITANNGKLCGCFFNCSERYRLSKETARMLKEVERLLKAGDIAAKMVGRNYLTKAVEHIPGPSIVNQTTASQHLAKVMVLLNNDDVLRIGVWGMGGVGKTTLIKSLNNQLKGSSSTHRFGIVIWVTVSQNLDLKKVQIRLAERLNLKEIMEESVQRLAIRLHQRLQKEKFLLILDDVWEPIDLESLGVPQSEALIGSKIIFTSCSLEVCRVMKVDKEVKVDVLNDEESWQLFTVNAGQVATSEHIESIARSVARECSGLPLAITIVGSAMRGKTMIELWTDALSELRRSVPNIKGIENKVYKSLKWSYDSLQETMSLLLQGNLLYGRIADGFLQAFESLKVLNLSETRIRSLPQSILQLGDLRILLLKECSALEELPQLDGLSKLQVLDCSDTGIRKLPKANDGQATFEELQNLKRLHSLSIRLEGIPSLQNEDLTLIGRLRIFELHIGREAIYFKSKSDDKRKVIIGGLQLSGEWIGRLLTNASSMQLNNCSGLNQMLEKLVIRSIGSYTGLKSLTITKSSSIFRPGGGCAAHDDLLPNLEELRLQNLIKLGSISELVGFLGLRFSRLKSIDVYRCDGLEYLLTCGDFTISLPKLETIHVSSCKSLVELFNFPLQENFVPEPVVPNLRTLKLVNLPRLKTLSRQDGSGLHSKFISCVYHMIAVEQVEVIKCDNLRKLPLTIQNANTMKEIRGNAQWWDQLELEAHNTKLSLELFFNEVNDELMMNVIPQI